MILSTNSSSSQSPDSTSVDLVTASFLPEFDTASNLKALHNKHLDDPNSMTMATSYTSFAEATAHSTFGHPTHAYQSTHYHQHHHHHNSHSIHNAQPMNEMTDFQDVSTICSSHIPATFYTSAIESSRLKHYTFFRFWFWLWYGSSMIVPSYYSANL